MIVFKENPSMRLLLLLCFVFHPSSSLACSDAWTDVVQACDRRGLALVRLGEVAEGRHRDCASYCAAQPSSPRCVAQYVDRENTCEARTDGIDDNTGIDLAATPDIGCATDARSSDNLCECACEDVGTSSAPPPPPPARRDVVVVVAVIAASLVVLGLGATTAAASAGHHN